MKKQRTPKQGIVLLVLSLVCVFVVVVVFFHGRYGWRLALLALAGVAGGWLWRCLAGEGWLGLLAGWWLAARAAGWRGV